MACKKCMDRGFLGYNLTTKKVVVCSDCFETRAKVEGLRKFLVLKLLQNMLAWIKKIVWPVRVERKKK